jgi:mannose-6-phosphate isomerase-like protein (cupin superfamily)
MVEEIRHGQDLLAIIIPHEYSGPGIRFFTPESFSQQLAYMQHPKGKVVQPHVHNPLPREVVLTQEVLFIKRGRVRVDFYDPYQNYCESRVLTEGDVILLASGGHGFEALDELEMIEVKQGPYAGEHEKTKFPGIGGPRAKVKE